MENSLKLQMDVKNNAEDLRRYMLDLKSWEEEMKQKESGLKNRANKVADIPPPRNKIKRIIKDGQGDKKIVPDDEKKPKKIHAYDYSAWDKFDADKACAELDEDQEEKTEASQINTQKNKDNEDKTKEQDKEIVKEAVGNSNLKNLDEAFYEKELGNLFVRKEKWEDAIKCYTKAIELDSRNAIYYANRSLCFIKLKNFRSAEVDATVAIQLDNSYVKAYQRRAFARLALGQIEEALSDYREVVKLEPKNAQANAEIIKIEKKLKSNVSNVKEAKAETKIFDPRTIFKAQTKKNPSVKLNQDESKKKEVEVKKKEPVKSEVVKVSKENLDSSDVEKKKVEEMKIEKPLECNEKDDIFGKIPDGFTIVKPVQVPPHLRPKKPFRRVPIKDVISETETFNELVNIFNSMLSQNEATEKKSENPALTLAKDEAADTYDIESFQKPETFFQFLQAWKTVKNNPQNAISYLEKITPEHLFDILKHNLESDLFGELISILSVRACLNSELVYTILIKLSQVDRLGSLLLFLSESDKKNLTECINNMEGTRTEWEIQDLREVYQLTNFV